MRLYYYIVYLFKERMEICVSNLARVPSDIYVIGALDVVNKLYALRFSMSYIVLSIELPKIICRYKLYVMKTE